ncbi:MAG: ubiquinol-cytochrome c reductase iron-sulfur subunit [Chloroflexi bacterium]|nr:ubiquinol-cytochrome c reductase iron-sulfur subunit [Chloroflexota bacterium]
MVLEDKKLERRSFLGIATWAIGGFISLGMGIPAISYIIGPSLQKSDDQEWIRLGPASKIELGTPTLFKTTVQRQTGWIVNDEEISAYIYTEQGREYIAFSNICTHLGCRVRWINDQDQFFCPCHNAVFNRDGEVETGPPPRALDRYQVKVEDGQVYIQGV